MAAAALSPTSLHKYAAAAMQGDTRHHNFMIKPHLQPLMLVHGSNQHLETEHQIDESAGGGRGGELLGGASLEPHRPCADGEFACDLSRCVRGAMRCDNFYDCIDMTDEANCSGSQNNKTNTSENLAIN